MSKDIKDKISKMKTNNTIQQQQDAYHIKRRGSLINHNRRNTKIQYEPEFGLLDEEDREFLEETPDDA